jgi:hypothetical protein
MEKWTRITSGFSQMEDPQRCSNCEFITHTMEQGVSACKIVTDVAFCHADKCVCGRWTPKYVPSEKEKILAKLTDHERKVLGL